MTIEQVAAALFFVVLAWACAAGIVLAVYLAFSVADFRLLGRAALFDSAPAMWLAPALLLLATRETTAGWLGLLLVSTAAVGLCSLRVPQRWEQPRHRAIRNPHSSAILGAFLVEIGICALYLKQPSLRPPVSPAAHPCGPFPL